MPSVKWKRYTEVFGGAMWVYIKRDITADKIIYNDFNPFLYNLWMCMTDDREYLLEKLDGFKLNDKETFHKNKKLIKSIESDKRDEFLFSIPNFNIASKYIYLLTHVFSGDISGGMKLSQNAWDPFVKKLIDPYYINKLENITGVYNLDCEDLIDLMDIENGFLYVDPPYYGKEHLYGFHNFDKDKHYSLAEKLKSVKSYWILSYYDYPDLKHLYPEDEYVWLRKEYTRSSSAVKNKGEKGVEVLVFPKSLQVKKEEKVNTFFE
jgi:DNA adenine methylase